MDQDIAAAVQSLDPENDAHWTADGLPAVQAVSEIVGVTVTRQQITDAGHDLRRVVETSAEPRGLDPSEFLARAQERFDEISGLIDDATRRMRDADAEIRQLQIERDQLRPYVTVEGERTHQQDTLDRMRFVQSANEQRQKLAQAFREAGGIGAPPPAPIDQARLSMPRPKPTLIKPGQ